MPELPEVESIAKRLRNGSAGYPSLIGKRIHSVTLHWQRSLVTPSVDEFLTRIQGQEMVSIYRRGKYLAFQLSRDTLIFHLRMSGDLVIQQEQENPIHHVRLTLELEKGCTLYFLDPRKFGRVWLVSQPEQIFAALGPEPFDENLTAEKFYASLKAVKRQIKPLLMDQSFIAGLGNIYTDEALHRAGIHPLFISNQLTLDQATALLGSIRKVLADGIQRNGASIDWVYRGGEFQNHFFVYHRKGEPCYRCGTPIERIRVGQRSTHFCPKCQILRNK
ncbi:MAG: DNA-formamidopyrimidine glycosylase [Anaerolineales bacterium]